MSSVNFEKVFLHMDVLCVKRYLDFTLAGIGSDLFVYPNDSSLLYSQQIFTGERIHSIVTKNDLIVLKGGRELCLIKFKGTTNKWEFEIVSKIHCNDWIQDFVMLENGLVGLVTAHNCFQYWDLGSRKLLSSFLCEEKCILYSCKIIGDSLENLVIFAGTVFGDVVIWAPILKENVILQRLKGHNGAVFSIEVKPHQKLLTTTSDDRSLKIWSITSPTPLLHPSDWERTSIQLLHTLFGHTARVWRSLILDNYYLTIGEDSQLVVWSNDGKMIKSLILHQESGIRALDYCTESGLITTGGEDGGINIISLEHLTTENEPTEVLNIGCSKVCYNQNDIVYCVNGTCVLVTKSGEEVLYKNEDFSSYCLLEVSTGGEYIVMGSIRGHLVVIDSNTRFAIIEEQIINGRVYSIHCLDHGLVTCGPEGQLDLWEISKDGLKHTGRKSLPHCKERWTTCGAVYKESLILGDRMGNVHIYDIQGGENPIKSFRKIHSHLGVTDLSIFDDGWVSMGRDGTLKEFWGLNVSKTTKLPMEWPWKMIRYKQDILILGFHSVCFVVWSMKHREVIASHNCGGGHRSCDYKLNNNKLSFLYVKDKKVFEVDLNLDGITRVRSGFHGKEINCLKILQTDPMVVVTGSEDTTLRFTKIDNSELNHVEVLKAHVSSIRAICASSKMVVSVGGKGQIIIWEYDVSTMKCKELVNHRLMKETRNWKSTSVAIDPEMRIMSVDVFKQQQECLIAVGCSDCQIRIFSHGEGLKQLCAIPYSHCILKVYFLKREVLVSMGTDGRVVFWDVSDPIGVKRLHEVTLHQSGINSFQFEEIDSGTFILATGGDDNSISVSLVEIMNGDVKTRRVWENRTTHSCQITGVKIIRDLFLTTSIDQRITVWKWSWHEGKFIAEFLHQWITPVPDIQGMDATCVGNSLLVAVHGKGTEIYKVDLYPES